MSRALLPAALLSLAAFVLPVGATHAHTVPADSPLVPTGVVPGQSFRLLFITSTKTTSTSSDIATYNRFVQAAANRNANLRPFKDEFRAVISTATVDARDNTATTRTDVPIYWISGLKAADDYADFYDNSFDSKYWNIRTETGTLRITYPEGNAITHITYPRDSILDWTEWWVWTGSNADGTKHATEYAGSPSGFVQTGSLNHQNTQRINSFSQGRGFPASSTFSLYALSPIFTVGPDTARPAKPADLTARGGDRQITLSWRNPNDHSIVKYHQIQKKTNAGAYGDWTDIPGSGKSTTFHIVKNLTNGTAYTFRIRAVDTDGPGEASDAVSATPVATTITPPRAQTVPEDWSLIPTGVGPGGNFRLLFITSTTRNAQSVDIADYNRFVQTAAGRNANLEDFKGEFRAVISTDTVDARDNTATTGAGVPIYWLGGEMVATGYADFYDGSWASSAGKNESGADHSVYVWSGSKANGRKFLKTFKPSILRVPNMAGSAYVSIGHTSNLSLVKSYRTWWKGGDGVPRYTSGSVLWPFLAAEKRHPLYALSPVLQVEDSGEPGREGETGTVEGALTARFEGVPAAHRGQGQFGMRLAFSAPVAGRAKTATIRVTGGTLQSARRGAPSARRTAASWRPRSPTPSRAPRRSASRTRGPRKAWTRPSTSR